MMHPSPASFDASRGASNRLKAVMHDTTSWLSAEVFGVEAFDESAVIIKARLKTQPVEQWNVGREYRRRLKLRFDAEKIEIPFPHRTLFWGNTASALPVQNTTPDPERFSSVAPVAK